MKKQEQHCIGPSEALICLITMEYCGTEKYKIAGFDAHTIQGF